MFCQRTAGAGNRRKRCGRENRSGCSPTSRKNLLSAQKIFREQKRSLARGKPRFSAARLHLPKTFGSWERVNLRGYLNFEAVTKHRVSRKSQQSEILGKEEQQAQVRGAANVSAPRAHIALLRRAKRENTMQSVALQREHRVVSPITEKFFISFEKFFVNRNVWLSCARKNHTFCKRPQFVANLRLFQERGSRGIL